jgi:hypothetical protein
VIELSKWLHVKFSECLYILNAYQRRQILISFSFQTLSHIFINNLNCRSLANKNAFSIFIYFLFHKFVINIRKQNKILRKSLKRWNSSKYYLSGFWANFHVLLQKEERKTSPDIFFLTIIKLNENNIWEMMFRHQKRCFL